MFPTEWYKSVSNNSAIYDVCDITPIQVYIHFNDTAGFGSPITRGIVWSFTVTSRDHVDLKRTAKWFERRLPV